MALEFNAQFTRFVEFAQTQTRAHNDEAIARDSGVNAEGGPLEGRVISVATTGDKASSLFKSLFRSRADKQANNDARTLFKQAVINMFGGAELIPTSVKEAMKTGDYEKGKPLTARRIIAVKTAIERAADVINPAVTRAKADLQGLYGELAAGEDAGERRRTIDGLVSAMVSRAADDPDALEVVLARSYDVLRTSTGQLRSADEVRAKVDSIRTSLSELRAAAKGDNEIFRLGKEMITPLAVKTIPAGLIRSMIRAVPKLDIDALQGLNGSSSVEDIYRAALEFDENVTKVMSDSGAFRALKDTDELNPARNFVASLILARCSDDVAGRIAQATASDSAKQLNSLYLDITNYEFTLTDVSPGLFDHLASIAGRMMTSLSHLHDVAQGRLGVPQANRQRLDSMDLENYNPYQRIIANLLGKARIASDKENSAFRAKVVEGKGRGADQVRDAYTRRFGPTAFGAPRRLTDSRNDIIKGLFNRRICIECRKLAKEDTLNSEFFKDIAGLDVTLKLGKDGEPIKLSNNYNAAHNQLVSFITRGEKTSVYQLSSAELAKLRLTMALLSNQTGTIATNAEMLSLDPKGRTNAMQFNGHATQTISLTLDTNGNLALESHVVQSDVSQITIKTDNNGEETVRAGAGSKVESTIRYTILSEELDRLAELDFKTYDDTVTENFIADQTVNQPYNTLSKNMGNNFEFRHVECLSKFKITVK